MEILNGLCALPGPRTHAENDFITKVSVMKQYAKARSIMENSGRNLNCNIVQMLCRELDDLRDEHKDTWNQEAEIILLGVQLSIYTHQLEHYPPHDSTFSNSSSSYNQEAKNDIIVNITLGIAVRLIDAFNSITITDPNTATPQRYLPKHYFSMLLVASTIIVKARTKYPSITAHASATAQNQLRQAYTILSAWSARKHDEPDRAARLIEVLSRAERQGNLKLIESSKDARTGIAVLSDAIMTAKELSESAKPSAATGLDHGSVSRTERNDVYTEATWDMQLRVEGEPDLNEQWVQEMLLDWDLGRHYDFQMDTQEAGTWLL